MAISKARRIWGWMCFDWAQQPFYTLGLTFIFGPYFTSVATQKFVADGSAQNVADAHAQSLWASGQTVAGLVIALSAPFLGAWADSSGRKMPWIAFFSIIYVICTSLLWGLTPDGATLTLVLVLFYVGFIASESALNFTNAILPSLGDDTEIGRISGSGSAFGYWGGVVSLFIMLLLLAENDKGVTLLGIKPLFGLDPATREGTRSVGPFIAIWYVVFMVPFFAWVKDGPRKARGSVGAATAWRDLKATLVGVTKRRSLFWFLISSMLYRDALNAVYAFGGVYAGLVLGWSIVQIGVFGIVAAIAAAIFTWAGGLMDQRLGPKPVITASVLILTLVSIIIVGMSRTHLFVMPLPAGSSLPDIIFYICGAAIGGAGGSVYAASRTMMVRHTHPDRPTEAFGLFALTGKATAFLAPFFITLFTWVTASNQLGFLPVIFLFLIGLWMLRWVNKDGDRAEWGALQ
ncbi:MAG: MFS transporter [Limimaricola sp.]|uniref:MFS transporter n=1 Tax=Limimaricola sp. TaxID=2211665 RepID=UPI001DAC9865|nr:MFS transporter [Limimaricola sp.]MBI1418863.1 MFS transporter [Limimaricola sp.]